MCLSISELDLGSTGRRYGLCLFLCPSASVSVPVCVCTCALCLRAGCASVLLPVLCTSALYKLTNYNLVNNISCFQIRIQSPTDTISATCSAV
jgi:hypothetical protein